MKFKFRLWSTFSNEVYYVDDQNAALRVFNNSRSLDRIDYKRVGDLFGWRYVSDNVLNRVPVAEIYQEDTRFDWLRGFIYAICGALFILLGLFLSLTS